jgi:quercetin dioxygenase-like cupin family protein
MTARTAAIAATLALALATPTLAAPLGEKIVSARFAPRLVEQIDAGDFHFTAGQPAPVHTHAAPAIGYVVDGTILYQVEGQKLQTLKAGSGFYEPVGPRIMRFDNGSAAKPAVFIDFNLQQAGEPFIVFPTPPTAKIDRRTLPTTRVGSLTVNGADGYALTLKPGERRTAGANPLPVLGYVAAGDVTVAGADGTPKRYAAGQTYSIAAGQPIAIANAGASPAKVIDFVLLNTGK